MRYTYLLTTGLILLVIFGTFALANVSTTTMTWFVATAKSLTVTYGSPCTSVAFFFPETKAFFDSDTDGNWAQVVPHTNRAGDTNCQTSAQAGMTVSNTGTSAINGDGNFASHLSGADVNVVLKVWLGTGSGCGTNGMGGWEKDCTITERDATTAPTTTTCRNFNVFNDINGGRLFSSLAVFGAQQLCFSGDGNGFVGAGDHNGNFQIGSDFS
ncbi:MAG: hypothetical protein FJY86_00845 [Candidatus Diapherotrites archaeon]|uniref:Uncharacterized protein n=1 Tax=Candidatus Iainarchaeum sp. TaxID=3101447 RepID=A0A8T4C5W0_9ARCH|nr:hypothetical protein [Candidatus Diapherotrites archaeon]